MSDWVAEPHLVPIELEVTKDVTHLVAEPNPDFDPDKPKLYDITGVTSIRIASGNLSAT